MTLDPRTPEGQGVLHRLAASADVVVANLPDAALAALGLDYASLAAVKPDIILTSVSAFGSGGPSSHKLGFDGIGQAMSGIMYCPADRTSPRSPIRPTSTSRRRSRRPSARSWR